MCTDISLLMADYTVHKSTLMNHDTDIYLNLGIERVCLP